MTPSTLDFAAFAVIVAVFTIVTMAVLLALVLHGKALSDALIAFCRKTFTTDGDHPACACDRFHTEVFCMSCRRVRVLTVTSTLSTADSNILLGDFEEERRRREAFADYEDIELDLEDLAVN